MQIVVIGGGAAGYFAAIHARCTDPAHDVLLLERTRKPLAKVRISGGGRCNVTHSCWDIRRLAENYPRGERFLRNAFGRFAVADTVAWFKENGVLLKTGPDGRMFPTTDRSETIVQALQNAAQRAGVKIHIGEPVEELQVARTFEVRTPYRSLLADRVIIATGGSPKPEGFDWLTRSGIAVVPPVPSLFTLNMPGDPIVALKGVTVDPVRLVLAGTRIEATGPLLITHWGFSGPAALRLSAWGARTMHEMGYDATVRVDWTGGRTVRAVHEVLERAHGPSPDKELHNRPVFGLPSRLWSHLLERAGVRPDKRCGDLGKHDRHRITEVLINDRRSMRGKTTFKEEFVTAGGVDLKDIDPQTMMSRTFPGLHFAGEVLDIDGITGGFNFQAAWTTGAIAGHAVVRP
ncbi:MAG: NAD(P)/FAD-dependent oxidoreductase [Flavobacteriales bacterium]|nr:NAD(P)/FAD-dependent oxidoreductase [Flavobacteriales bacterium]MCB9168147.1 NAD(P)/FAD-dependent oxidoreductase [Flavobacteriales bacterium]MCB9194288.1 NAD(P)/FAD-dependent oxidoreductase [Flavobacteriales bacterium]